METNNITDFGLTYEWKLTGLRKVDTLGLEGVIIGTNWKLIGKDEDGFEGTFTGATPFKVEELDTEHFTSFNDLTEEQVLGWIQNVVYSQSSYWEHINTQILKAIRDVKSPVVVIGETDLPWSSASGLSVTPQPTV